VCVKIFVIIIRAHLHYYYILPLVILSVIKHVAEDAYVCVKIFVIIIHVRLHSHYWSIGANRANLERVR